MANNQSTSGLNKPFSARALYVAVAAVAVALIAVVVAAVAVAGAENG